MDNYDLFLQSGTMPRSATPPTGVILPLRLVRLPRPLQSGDGGILAGDLCRFVHRSSLPEFEELQDPKRHETEILRGQSTRPYVSRRGPLSSVFPQRKSILVKLCLGEGTCNMIILVYRHFCELQMNQ